MNSKLIRRKTNAINEIKEIVDRYNISDFQMKLLLKRYKNPVSPYKHIPIEVIKRLKYLYRKL